jgi:hypothetical protein
MKQTIHASVVALVYLAYGNLAATGHFDTHPSNRPTSYIYAPGLMGTEIMMGRYCPSFVASTGEKITWQYGGHVIGHPYTAVVFPEVDLRKPHGFTLNPVRAVMNTLRRDLFPLAKRYFQDNFHFTVEENPDSSKSIADYSFNFGQANIAQHKDIRALRKTYEQHAKRYPNSNMVLFGDSRGAATIFNFLAQKPRPGIKAAVMEGIFDTVPHCVKHFLYNNKDPRAEKRLNSILSLVMGSYKADGPSPLAYAQSAPKDLPLLLVTSLNDGIVAPQCTLTLYKKLKEQDPDKVHLLVLNNPSHPCYMIDNDADRELYENVVHAFYKHYGLAHNSARAQAGYNAFMHTQPTIAYIDQTYALATCSLCQH